MLNKPSQSQQILLVVTGPPGPSSYRPPGPGGYPPPGPQGYPGYPGQQGPPMGQVEHLSYSLNRYCSKSIMIEVLIFVYCD